MKKYLTPIVAGLAVLLVAGAAIALTGGTTDIPGFLRVRGATLPTCATATGDGDICASDAIEANGALDVGGAATITGAATLSSVAIAVIGSSDVAATCTVGDFEYDTGATDELCYCHTTDTWACWTVDTADGPTD